MPRYAAIDIGSNSVRMMAAKVEPRAAMRTLAEDARLTRLGESVFRTGSIDPAAIDYLCTVSSAWSPPTGARHAGDARRSDRRRSRRLQQRRVHERVNAILDQPVEVISGQEEARLIHLGVETRWPHPNERISSSISVAAARRSLRRRRASYARLFRGPWERFDCSPCFSSRSPSPVDLQRMEEFIDESSQWLCGALSRGLCPRHRHIGVGLGDRLGRQPDS